MDEICTRCGKKIENTKIEINLGFSVFKRENNVWGLSLDLNQKSVEILCANCFDNFCNTLFIKNNNEFLKNFNTSKKNKDPVEIDGNVDYN